MTHTSGLANPDNLSEKEYIEVEHIVNLFKDKPLSFTPGESFSYGFSSYVLLTYIIEKISCTKYEDFLTENVFKPLDMHNTGYDVQSRIIKNRASGYYPNEDRLINGQLQDMSVYAGAAGLYSTVNDLYVWDQALHTQRLLSKNSLDRMFHPYEHNYGYGWHVVEQTVGSIKKRAAHHGGHQNGGFSTHISRFLDDQIVIIILSNHLLAPMEGLTRDLPAIVFGQDYRLPKRRHRIELNPETYDVYAGTYESFVPVIVTKEGKRLFLSIFGFKLELVPGCENMKNAVYFTKYADISVAFQKNEAGEVTGATIRFLGGDGFQGQKIT